MAEDMFRLDGKAAVVTGAGRGIGAATARALAGAGADVVLSARSADQLAKVADQVAALGRRAEVVPADLSDLEVVPSLAEAARDAFGRLDIVVNNVGGTTPRPLIDTSTGYMARAFSFNVLTAHALTRASVPIMLEGGGGSIVNISSAVGRFAGRGYLAYGTAKAALTHYSRLAAADLAPRIRVNAIAVGAVATSALDVVVQDEGLRGQVEQTTPLRRLGQPEEVAATVLYLCAAAGGYVTGKVIELDGGIQQPNLDIGTPDV